MCKVSETSLCSDANWSTDSRLSSIANSRTMNFEYTVGAFYAFHPLITSQEISDEIVLVNSIVFGLIFKVSQYMALLFPEIHQFLEFHLALGVKYVAHIQVGDKPLSLELLSDLGLDVRNWHVQFVQVTEFSGISDILAVQMKDSSSHISLREGPTGSLSKFCCKRHFLLG